MKKNLYLLIAFLLIGCANERNGIEKHQYNRNEIVDVKSKVKDCLLYTSPSPRDLSTSRMPSSA